MATPLAQDKQRLWDLVRYYRRQFHEAGLITDNEYAELAQDHGAVVSLETRKTTQAPTLGANAPRRVYPTGPRRYKAQAKP